MQTLFLIATLMVVIGRTVYGVLDVAARGLSEELCSCRNEKTRRARLKWRSVGADSRLNLRLIDIEIGVDVLHVVVLFERFHQPDHLRGLRPR